MQSIICTSSLGDLPSRLCTRREIGTGSSSAYFRRLNLTPRLRERIPLDSNLAYANGLVDCKPGLRFRLARTSLAPQRKSNAHSLRATAGQGFFELPFLGGNNSAKNEFLQQLLSEAPDGKRLDELLDTLLSSPVPFKRSALCGGPWEVVYTRGPLLWQRFTNYGGQKPGQRKKGNKAYQDFQFDSLRVENYGEVAGGNIYVTAEGTFTVLGQTKQTPVEIEASVERGALHVFGFKLPLPIKGSGFVSLAYTDGKAVRVFRSSRGSISVQVKQTLLR